MPFRPPRQRIVPGTGLKIYDITHADTNEHSVALPAGYPANTKALVVKANRIAGTGAFTVRSVSGVDGSGWTLNSYGSGTWLRAADGLFYYFISVAGDDWDIYAVGYITG